ncbi:MAG TPA: aromatic amino acid ammonia-lyase [Solirubrobacteraceae bacterium]|nr:aromatic amino acid ammonia-lyase [Solirubrobacteraceae bacterium]
MLRLRTALTTFAVALGCVFWSQVGSALAYDPITPLDQGQTITLNGHNLTINKLVAIARYGAKVQLSPDARQRSLNAYYLLLEGSREGIPVYFFNRGTGAGRQTVEFAGDPLSTTPIPAGQAGAPDNRDFIAQRELSAFQSGPSQGIGPAVNDEEIVRAMMAERVSTMSYEAATPQATQMLIDMLNRDVTPVVESRGSPGEGDLPQMENVMGTMVGEGDAYYHGALMPAGEALAKAGLLPLQQQPAQYEAPVAPFGADDAALESTNAYSVGQAALLAYDARDRLNWQDLVTAENLDGMNSSITPESTPVQQSRPFTWLNYDAGKTLKELNGSYLFNLDQVSSTGVPFRIIQDPESLRAITQRTGSAWEAWNTLVTDVTTQMNSSDHNPAVTPGYSPRSAPELSTPWFMQYYVRGGPDDAACKGGGVGPATGCQHGYIMSNANWDPYPIDNDVEALTNALVNVAVNDALIPDRFENLLPANGGFTVISGPTDPSLGSFAVTNGGLAPRGTDYTIASLFYEILAEQNPVPPTGLSIISTVEDLQAASTEKVARARLVVDDLSQLLGQDMMTATYWMDTRQLQGEALAATPGSGVTGPRNMGTAATAAWKAFRQVVPWQVLPPNTRPNVPPGELAYAFMQANPATCFFPNDGPEAYAACPGQAVQMAGVRTTRFLKKSKRAGGLRNLLLVEAQIRHK